MFEGKDMRGKVLRLWRALHGLKQSPRMWNIHVDRALVGFGLLRLTSNLCVYVIYNGDDQELLGLFVDDIFISGEVMGRIGC